jgi:hypothetical protein
MTGLRSQRSMKRGCTPTPVCSELPLFKGGHFTQIPSGKADECNGELVLKNSFVDAFSLPGEFLPVRVFLAVVCFLRGCHRWLRSPVEEPHQSFQVLCHSSQVELLTHELDSA